MRIVDIPPHAALITKRALLPVWGSTQVAPGGGPKVSLCIAGASSSSAPPPWPGHFALAKRACNTCMSGRGVTYGRRGGKARSPNTSRMVWRCRGA